MRRSALVYSEALGIVLLDDEAPPVVYNMSFDLGNGNSNLWRVFDLRFRYFGDNRYVVSCVKDDTELQFIMPGESTVVVQLVNEDQSQVN